jgi:RNA polymerase sigma-70 factor (ECF subfamily)
MESIERALEQIDVGVTGEFSAAVQPHLLRLKKLVAKQLPPNLADDAVQDSLLRAFRSWPTFDQRRPLWPWLAGIATRACVEAWRAESRWQREGIVEGEAMAPDHLSPGSDRHVTALDSRRAVIATLAGLEPRERFLLYASDIEERPRRVLAQTAMLSPGAARVALHRARERFRKSITDRWHDLGVASALAFGRWRRRTDRMGDRQPALQVISVSASVALSLAVGTVVAQSSASPRLTAARSLGASSDRVVDVAVIESSTRSDARNQEGAATTSTASSVPTGRVAPPSPLAGVPRHDIEAAVGPDGAYGGLRVEWTTPDGGYLNANPEVRCRHSTATSAFCLVVGSLPPSVGPVAFYGSGDGNP